MVAGSNPVGGSILNMNTITPGVYKHFKGNLYLVVGRGINTETNEPYAVYKNLLDFTTNIQATPFHIRPEANFLEEVNDNGTLIKRFTLLTDEETLEELANLAPLEDETPTTV